MVPVPSVMVTLSIQVRWRKVRYILFATPLLPSLLPERSILLFAGASNTTLYTLCTFCEYSVYNLYNVWNAQCLRLSSKRLVHYLYTVDCVQCEQGTHCTMPPRRSRVTLSSSLWKRARLHQRIIAFAKFQTHRVKKPPKCCQTRIHLPQDTSQRTKNPLQIHFEMQKQKYDTNSNLHEMRSNCSNCKNPMENSPMQEPDLFMTINNIQIIHQRDYWW